MLDILAAAASSTAADSAGGGGISWGAISAAAAVGGLVATIVTTALSTYLRYRNRPEPDWHIRLGGRVLRPGNRMGFKPGYTLQGTLSNVGDGVAHSVRVSAKKPASAGLRNQTPTGGVAPLMDRGAVEQFSVHVPLSEWDNAQFGVEWIDPPTRLRKKRVIFFEPKDFMKRPGLDYTDPETGVASKRYVEDEVL